LILFAEWGTWQAMRPPGIPLSADGYYDMYQKVQRRAA